MDRELAVTMALDSISSAVMIPLIDEELNSDFTKASLKMISDVCLRQAAVAIKEFDITLDELMELYNSVNGDESESIVSLLFEMGIPTVYDLITS